MTVVTSTYSGWQAGYYAVMNGELPTWWRAYWAVVSFAIVGLMVTIDDFAQLVPALVTCGSACFWLEYLSTHRR